MAKDSEFYKWKKAWMEGEMSMIARLQQFLFDEKIRVQKQYEQNEEENK